MIVLIVEDDANKLAQIRDAVQAHVRDAQVAEARSYRSGLHYIMKHTTNCVLLDMSMPTFDQSYAESGGRMRPFAGVDILREMKRKRLPGAVIVVTQFESFGEGADTMTLAQLQKRLEAEYRPNYLGSVSYQPSSSNWRTQLGVLLKQAEDRARVAK